MSALRKRNAALLFKIETTEGVAVTPSASTDAVLVEAPQLNFNPQNVQTNEVTGSIDNRGPIVGGLQASISFSVYAKGSGTAGTAPEVGDLLRACGWAETITATAVPAAAEACGAGGSTTTAQLGASASATAQLYRGMPITFSSGQTLSTFITNYTTGKIATLAEAAAGTINAGVNYQIPVNVLYSPASTGIPTGTLYYYEDGVLTILKGVRGTFTMEWTAAGAVKLNFTMSGEFVSKTDVAVPACTYDSTRPPIWRSGKSLVDRAVAVVSRLNFDCGNNVVYPENPTSTEGFDTCVITERAMAGQIDPQATLVATRSILTDMRNGTQKIINALVGTAVGNRVGITIPAALYTGASPSDRQGLATEDVPFSCIGQDAGAFLCFY